MNELMTERTNERTKEEKEKRGMKRAHSTMQSRKIVRMQRAKQKVYLFDSKVFGNAEWLDTPSRWQNGRVIDKKMWIPHNTTYDGRVDSIHTVPCVRYLILQFTIFSGDHIEHKRI